MREILFRAKDNGVLNGIWQYGSLDISNPDAPEIVLIDRHNNKMRIPILIETVGQYTGLTDKNGKKIFEDDVVKGKDNLEKDIEVYGFVDHENGSFVIVGDSITHYRWLDYDVEVIGNIHDNPELLKGGAEE